MSNPSSANIALVMEKIIKAKYKLLFSKLKARPTEKLSKLTVREKNMIDNILVIGHFISSSFDIYISIARIKNIIPTIILELLIIKSNFLPTIDPIKGMA